MQIPRLHPDTVEEVKQRIDIVDIVSDYVVLRKQGRNLAGLCPFHQEKTGSFTVNPIDHVYHCFGCAAGGDAIKFLMEIGKQSFAEVILDLANRYQVPIKTVEVQDSREISSKLSIRDSLYEVMAVAVTFYQNALKQPQGQIALDYLLRQRQLNLETIESFGLGYAPGGWENLYRYLVESKHYPVALVEKAGLIKSRQAASGYYDLFRERLMIPIKDLKGRAIAFGSRSLGSQEPKYLNSPDTDLFDKSKVLFALDRAKKSISQKDQAIVVEGYFDVIALHSAGIENVVAVLGTSFSLDQLNQLLRFSNSKEILFNFDTDQAGISAIQRALKEIEPLIYSEKIQVKAKVLQLPHGKDPDEFLRSDPDAVNEYLKIVQDAPSWLDWQITQLIQGKDLDKSEHFQQISQGISQLLGKLENSNMRTNYIEKCAEILANGKERLIPVYVQNLQAQIRQSPKKSPTVISKSNEHSLLERAEYFLLLNYLHYPQYRQNISDLLDEKEIAFTIAKHRSLWHKIVELNQYSDYGQSLLESLRDYYLQQKEEFLEVSDLFSLTEKEYEDSFRIAELIEQSIVALEQAHLEIYRQLCLQRWQNSSIMPNGDPSYFLQEYYQTQTKILELIKHSKSFNKNI